MRGVIVFMTLGVFFFLIAYFVIQNFPPFDLARLQELIQSEEVVANEEERLKMLIVEELERGLFSGFISNNGYLVLGLIFLSIFSFTTSLHLFFDKIFFKNFFTPPSLFNAVRRSALINVSLGLVIYLRVLEVELVTLFVVPATAIIIEMIFMGQLKKYSQSKESELTDKKD